MQEGGVNYQRPRYPEYLVLSQRSYRINVSLSFLVWAAVLSPVFIFRIPTFLERDDFSTIAQISADISAICLALFSLIQAISPRNNYLKLVLATLSLDFILVTLLSVLVLATTDVASQEPFKQTLAILVLMGILVVISIKGALEVQGINSIIRRFVAFARLRVKPAMSENRAAGYVSDYSPLMLPFIIIILWSSPLNLASATLVLMIGGLINAVVLSIIFAVQTVRQTQAGEDKFKSTILEILQEIHEERCAGPLVNTTGYKLVKPEALSVKLAEKGIFKNVGPIEALLRQMGEENSIFARYNGYYIFPKSKDTENIYKLLEPVTLVVTGYTKDNYNQKSYNGYECTFLCEFFSTATRYPVEIVELFFLPKVFADLRANFDFIIDSKEVDEGEDMDDEDTNIIFALYAKSVYITPYERCQGQQGKLSSEDKRIVVRDYCADLPIHGLVTIPRDLSRLSVDERCKRLFEMGLMQILNRHQF